MKKKLLMASLVTTFFFVFAIATSYLEPVETPTVEISVSPELGKDHVDITNYGSVAFYLYNVDIDGYRYFRNIESRSARLDVPAESMQRLSIDDFRNGLGEILSRTYGKRTMTLYFTPYSGTITYAESSRSFEVYY